MKIFKTLSIALLAVSSINAQGQNLFLSSETTDQNTRHTIVVQQLLHQKGNIAQKSTEMKQRLVARAEYQLLSTGFEIRDSSIYFYGSDDRGSKFNLNSLDYNINGYDPFSYPMFQYPFIWNTLDCMSDSMKLFWNYGNGLQISQQSSIAYGDNRQPVSYTLHVNNQGNPIRSRFIYSYDGNGNLISLLKLSWIAFGWFPSERKQFYYNTQGKIIGDTTFSGAVPLRATEYLYDNSGNLIFINGNSYRNNVWQPHLKYTNTYDPNNRLRTLLYEKDYNGVLRGVFRDSFGYTNNSEFFTYHFESEYDNNGILQPKLILERLLNSQNNLPDSTWVSVWLDNQWTSGFSKKVNYNNYNNPSHMTIYSNPGWPNVYPKLYEHYYYYEEYDALTSELSVKNIATVNATITVFPNPAANNLNICWRDFRKGSPVSVRIVNVSGQVVYKDDMKWMQTTESFVIADLQPGTYWLSITDAAGQSIFNQSFAKQ